MNRFYGVNQTINSGENFIHEWVFGTHFSLEDNSMSLKDMKIGEVKISAGVQCEMIGNEVVAVSGDDRLRTKDGVVYSKNENIFVVNTRKEEGHDFILSFSSENT